MSEEIISKVDNDTFVLTSQKYEQKALEQAIYDYNNKSNYRSTVFNEKSSIVNFNLDDIDNLSFNAQSDLNKIMKINNIIRYFVNKNDLLGKTYESIESNINAEWDLSFPHFDEKDEDNFKIAEELIRKFNEKVGINQLITTSIPMTYMDGTYVLYLRKDSGNNNYQVDYYPLGVCEVADYTEGGEPYVLINMKELRSRLNKIYKKNKKNQPLFYKNLEEEIKETYPPEVYEALINKENFAKLDIKSTGVMRINNLNRKYGLSPIFKSLKPVIRLENIELSDDKNTLVRGKKIIFQRLTKELFTEPEKVKNITWSQAQAKSHVDLMTALNQKGISIFTGLPWTESIEYVEPKIEPTNVQVKNNYKNQIMTAVGIAYLSADKNSYGAAQISIKELLKVINRIGEQLERILEKWYKGILIDNGLDPYKYCPKIKVFDSEKLDMELSMDLARMLNTELNASLHTVYKVLGLDIDLEAHRRQKEKEKGLDDIFQPRQTAYTNSGNSEGSGNPRKSNDPTKEGYDEDYNKENNR